MALNPHLYPKMAYDWDRDIQPITLLVKVPNVLAVNMDVPAKNVAELIAYAKQNPGKLTFSSSGVGNPQQLTGELFNKMAGVQIRHVPVQRRRAAARRVAGKDSHADLREHRRREAVHRQASASGRSASPR